MSESIDQMIQYMTAARAFSVPRDPQAYAEHLKFKFHFIAYAYKKLARSKGIGTPIDVLLHGPRAAVA